MSSRYYSVLAVAVLAMAAFAGAIIVGEDTDAEEATGYSVSYIVDGKTYTVPYENGTVALSTLADLGATAPKDKTFTAWKQTKDGVETSYTAGSTLILDSTSKTATLVAQFEWTTYTATFKALDGTTIKTITGTAQTPVSLSTEAPAAPAVDGKIFAGWLAAGAEKALKNAELGTLSEDIAYTATYVIDYKVTFVDGDKTYISKVSDLTVPDVGERTGYTFLGWFVGTEQVADPTAYAFTEDTTFSAKWEPINVFVTFTAGSFSTTVAVLYGQTVVEPALPDGFSKWDFDFTKPITEDITVVAIESEKPAPSGLSNPMTAITVALAGLLLCIIVAVLILKRNDISKGIVKRLDKEVKEEKKE